MDEKEVDRRLSAIEAALVANVERWGESDARERALSRILACIVRPLRQANPLIVSAILTNLSRLEASAQKMNEPTAMIEFVRHVRHTVERYG